MKRIAFGILFLAIGLLLPPVIADSADFTVDSASAFQAALVTAEGNGVNDVITVVADISVSSTLTYEATGSQTLAIIGSGSSPVTLSGIDTRILSISSFGGAITIENLRFQNGNSMSGGGGIYVFSDGGVTIRNCYFYNNHSDLSGGGANISGYPITLTGNIFDRNTAGNGGGGCSVSSSFNNTVLDNNYFLRNGADGNGGGADLSVLDFGSATLTNNRFVLNRAGQNGSSLYMSARATTMPIPLTLTNNSCAWEYGAYPTNGGTSGFFVNFLEGWHVADVYNNILWHINAGGTDLVIQDDSTNFAGAGTANVFNNFYLSRTVTMNTGGTLSEGGNITSGDPGFEDYPGGDLHLRATSLAIDAGVNAAPSLPSFDFEGDARILDGTVDIGADEFLATPLPDIAVTPSSIPFPDVIELQSSTPREVTISNTGGAVLTVTGITLTTGTNYSVAPGGSNPCSSLTPTIGAGENCTVEVTFRPTVVGTNLSDSLAIASDDPPTITIFLSGNGVAAPAPAISVAPASIAFGDVLIGDSSNPQVVTLSNTGSAPLNISEIYLDADPGSSIVPPTNFILDLSGGPNGCGIATPSIAAGGNCTVSVIFIPENAWVSVIALGIVSNDPPEVTVLISGNGVTTGTPNLSVAPDAIDFHDVQFGLSSPPREVTISNTGTADLNVTGIALTTGTDYSVVAGGSRACANLTPTIVAGDNCTVQVTFTPTLVANDITDTLEITSDDTATATVPLSGNGVADPIPGISVTPTAIDFGFVRVRSSSRPQVVTISNTGSVTLNVLLLKEIGDYEFFYLDLNGGGKGCGSITPSIEAMDYCTVSVIFNPWAERSYSSLLEVFADDYDSGGVYSTQTAISLSGNGYFGGIGSCQIGINNDNFPTKAASAGILMLPLLWIVFAKRFHRKRK